MKVVCVDTAVNIGQKTITKAKSCVQVAKQCDCVKQIEAEVINHNTNIVCRFVSIPQLM